MARKRKNPGELLLMGGNPSRRHRNPGELLLMGANPLRKRESRAKRSPYDKLSVEEKLAFGRLGLGKAQLQSASDIRRARKKVADVGRFRNALPNPGGELHSPDSSQADHARDLYQQFHEHASDKYIVTSEPHIPAGDYTDLGKLIALRVKPQRGGNVQEFIFPYKNIRVISSANGRQIYFACDGQEQSEADLEIFTTSDSDRIELGDCRSIVYAAAKWHHAVPDTARGKMAEWEHQFGEDGGFPPKLFYIRSKERLALEGGTYHVEGAGIVN